MSENRDFDAVIEPRKGAREKSLPPDCLLVFTPQDKKLICQCFEEPPALTHKLFLVDVAQGSFKGRDMAIVGPMLGAPQAILALEKLVALGARRVLAFGWCGSLQQDVRIGDVVIPTAALSEEGTSAHYPLPDGFLPGPSGVLLRLLTGVLTAGRDMGEAGGQNDNGLTVHRGRIWSIDAPYRETIQKVIRYQREGILAVDMETSALFTVARYRGIELAGVLVVSDELSSLHWVHGFKEARFLDTRKRLVRAVLETISTVDGHDGK
jgi:uridine phosphorylase